MTKNNMQNVKSDPRNSLYHEVLVKTCGSMLAKLMEASDFLASLQQHLATLSKSIDKMNQITLENLTIDEKNLLSKEEDHYYKCAIEIRKKVLSEIVEANISAKKKEQDDCSKDVKPKKTSNV